MKPSNAIKRNWAKVMMFPHPGNSLKSKGSKRVRWRKLGVKEIKRKKLQIQSIRNVSFYDEHSGGKCYQACLSKYGALKITHSKVVLK